MTFSSLYPLTKFDDYGLRRKFKLDIDFGMLRYNFSSCKFVSERSFALFTRNNSTRHPPVTLHKHCERGFSFFRFDFVSFLCLIRTWWTINLKTCTLNGNLEGCVLGCVIQNLYPSNNDPELYVWVYVRRPYHTIPRDIKGNGRSRRADVILFSPGILFQSRSPIWSHPLLWALTDALDTSPFLGSRCISSCTDQAQNVSPQRGMCPQEQRRRYSHNRQTCPRRLSLLCVWRRKTWQGMTCLQL